MAARTYREQVIVLRKTKLKESDLILTLLAADGRQVRAVAKGARKPTSSFAARLDLFGNARVMLVEGRSLDIVKEARLVDAHEALRCDMGLSACASPMAELLARATQDALPVPRLFDMTQAGLSRLESCVGTARLLLCAAFLWKACALLGFRPFLEGCVECGRPLPGDRTLSAPQSAPVPARASEGEAAPSGPWLFAPQAGGLLCGECARAAQGAVQPVDPVIVGWADALIGRRFDEVASLVADEETAFAILRLVRDWVRAHIGRLKSLELLLSMRLY